MQHFPDVQLISPETPLPHSQTTFLVPANQLISVCSFLHTEKTTSFEVLSCLTAVDYPDFIETVYHLQSISHGTFWVLKTRAAKDCNSEKLPSIPSITSIWAAANWYEREVYDLLGVYFENHPNLERILMPKDWEGFPLRKDYNNVTDYHKIPTAL